MKREILYLNADSFTSTSACVREVQEIIRQTEESCSFHGKYEISQICTCMNVTIRANPKQHEELESELEPIKQQWRVKVEDVA